MLKPAPHGQVWVCVNAAGGDAMGVQRSVRNERIHPTSRGGTNEVQGASNLLQVSCLGFGGHPLRWPLGEEEEEWCLQCIISLSLFRAEGTWGRLGETWGSRPSCLVAGASLLFPRTPARITTCKCVERSRSACLHQTYRRKKRGGSLPELARLGMAVGELSHGLPLRSS